MVWGLRTIDSHAEKFIFSNPFTSFVRGVCLFWTLRVSNRGFARRPHPSDDDHSCISCYRRFYFIHFETVFSDCAIFDRSSNSLLYHAFSVLSVWRVSTNIGRPVQFNDGIRCFFCAVNNCRTCYRDGLCFQLHTVGYWLAQSKR